MNYIARIREYFKTSKKLNETLEKPLKKPEEAKASKASKASEPADPRRLTDVEKPKSPVNRLTIKFRDGSVISFDNTDDKHKDSPSKDFGEFVKWYANPKSKKHFFFVFRDGMRMILKSEITTFDIQSLENK